MRQIGTEGLFNFIQTQLCSLTSDSLTQYPHVVDEQLASDNTGANEKLGPRFYGPFCH